MRLSAAALATWAAALSLLLDAGAARAQSEGGLAAAPAGLPERHVTFAVDRGWVTMSTSWRDVVSAKIRDKLQSGLPTVIVARIYLFPEGVDRPVRLGIKTCRVVFDLWDEIYRIDLRQGGRRQQTIAVNVEGVMRRCGEARGLALASLNELGTARSYFAGLLVEVNPLSSEMMERIKGWVARPNGVGAVGPGDSLFGSFVGLFVTHVPAADETLRFRTQLFVPSTVPAAAEPPR